MFLNHHTLLRFPGFKDKAVTFSYDDGTETDIKLAEIFTENNLKCTFNVSSETKTEEQFLRLKEAYDKGGHEIACHGAKHRSLGELHPEHAIRDILAGREVLEKHFSKVVKGMAYANGNFTEDVKTMLKYCGINYARTTLSTEKFTLPSEMLNWNPTCHHDNPKLFELLEQFFTPVIRNYYWSKTPRLFYVWGHSFEFEQKDNWDRIEEFAKKVSGRNDVYYATNGEIFEYITAFERLEFSVDDKYVYNPSAIDVYVNFIEKDVVAKAGQTVEIKG